MCLLLTIFGHDIILYTKKIKDPEFQMYPTELDYNLQVYSMDMMICPPFHTHSPTPLPTKFKYPSQCQRYMYVKTLMKETFYQYKSVSCFHNSGFKLLVSFSNFEDNTFGNCEMKMWQIFDTNIVSTSNTIAYITSKDSMQENPHHVLLRQAM